MQLGLPLTRDVVLIGGGHTHALVLRKWGMRPLAGARLTLINPDPAAPYSGMLPGHVAGHYDRDALMIDLVRLARFAGARLILGRAEGIDREARTIRVPGRAPVHYDITSIDIGITSDMPAIPGFADHAHPAKPLAPFADAWQAHVDRVAGGGSREAVVIGGGVAGMELALAMAHRLGKDAVSVVEAADKVLPGLAWGTRQALIDEAKAVGVSLRTGAGVAAVGPDHVELADGTRLPSAFTAGAAGAKAQTWLTETGLELTDGFVTVGPTLASVTDPAIFAVGDCAHLSHAPRPKAGVYAVRQAPVLYDNLVSALSGRALRPYRPQKDYLKLISAGARRAVADRSGLRTSGRWLWRWKDWIDRRFMAQFDTLTPMAPPAPPELAAEGVREAAEGPPPCGGCAAKVGRGALADALTGLPVPARGDVLTGPGDDAAVIALGEARQVLTTDHLRAFTEDPWLLARIASVHALGDIWAMGARPQAALAQIVLPPLSPRLQTATLAEIMQAATEVFGAAGASIVGGHSATGAELSIGFTVTGLSEGRLIGQSGAKAGDVLILTKPLGTGVILAAEMQLKARGDWVAGAFTSMTRPQDGAARALAHAAHAMTDVTGFGLAGHLMGLLEASGVAARLDLATLPVLEGAEALIALGFRSSLHASNAALRARLSLPDTVRAELLFDPQTAGGLLAAVRPDRAEKALEALTAEGFVPAVIGTLEEGPPGIVAA